MDHGPPQAQRHGTGPWRHCDMRCGKDGRAWHGLGQQQPPRPRISWLARLGRETRWMNSSALSSWRRGTGLQGQGRNDRNEWANGQMGERGGGSPRNGDARCRPVGRGCRVDPRAGRCTNMNLPAGHGQQLISSHVAPGRFSAFLAGRALNKRGMGSAGGVDKGSQSDPPGAPWHRPKELHAGSGCS